MRINQACPKCHSTQVWIIDSVVQPTSDSYGMNPLVVTTAMMPETNWLVGPLRMSAGTFEAWICVQCGFTEWYAKNANEKLAELAQLPDSGVRLLDTGAPRGPFR